MKKLYQIDVGYACGGVVVDSTTSPAIVVEAAPIFKWMVGKTWVKAKEWAWKRGQVRECGD